MLLLGLAGTGTGCLLGVLVSFFLIPVVIKISGDQKSSYVGSVMICFHPVILIATVLLFCRNYDFPCSQKTCKNGCKYLSDGGTCLLSGSRKRRKGRKKRKHNTETSWGQFTKDKKRTTVVILSLATSLSVYLCITTMLDSQAAKNNRVE